MEEEFEEPIYFEKPSKKIKYDEEEDEEEDEDE